MGYTHYWYRTRSFTPAEWKSIKIDCHKIITLCSGLDIDLRYEFDRMRHPSITNEHIRFNGQGEQGHETFFMARKLKADRDINKPVFDFCKTAAKPYDLAVCLILLRIAHYVPSDFVIKSDGAWDTEWEAARRAYTMLFLDTPANPL